MKPDTPGLPFDDTVGAFLRENQVALEGASSGPLSGLTFAVKDVCMANSYLLLRCDSSKPRLPQISWVLRFPSLSSLSARVCLLKTLSAAENLEILPDGVKTRFSVRLICPTR